MMVIKTPLSRKNVARIEEIVKTLAHDTQSVGPEEREKVIELGNALLVLRDILWLSYGVDIRDFGVEGTRNLQVNDEETNRHFLDTLRRCFILKGTGMPTENLLDHVVYRADVLNEIITLDSDGGIIRMIMEGGDYSLKKARDLIGTKETGGIVITGQEMYHMVTTRLHDNYQKMRRLSLGLLTFSGLLDMPASIDIFADFYVAKDIVEEYKKRVGKEMESEIEKRTEDQRKKKEMACNALYDAIEKGDVVKVRNLSDVTFRASVANYIQGTNLALERHFPDKAREIKRIAKEIEIVERTVRERYDNIRGILEKATETGGAEPMFSAERAKALTDDRTLLFTLFNCLSECYKT